MPPDRIWGAGGSNSSGQPIPCVSRLLERRLSRGALSRGRAPSQEGDLTWRIGPAAPPSDSRHHAGHLQRGPAHQQVSLPPASQRCPWCRSMCAAPQSPSCWQCRSSAFAGTRAVKAAFANAQPSCGRAQLVVRTRQGGRLGRRCVAHLPLRRRPRASSSGGGQAGGGARCSAPSFAAPLAACVQVYAKGKQRMRTGGNTRMTQQMQQQMVRAVHSAAAAVAAAVAAAPCTLAPTCTPLPGWAAVGAACIREGGHAALLPVASPALSLLLLHLC
jgi:hypothetical protein